MALSRSWLCPLFVALLLAAAKGMADTPPRTEEIRSTLPARGESGRQAAQPASASSAPASERPGAAGNPLSLEMLKIPAGAIVVVCEEARDALRLIPNMVVLTPQEYQRLQEQIDQLKRQNETDKPVSPSSCKLSGHVDSDWVYLRAEFEFKTERPKTTINLGCLRSWPTAAALDGGQASLVAGDEGFVLQVDTAGIHKAVLDLMSRWSSKGTDRIFDLDLPRAAITTLEHLDLPAAVPEVRVGSRSFRTIVDPQRSRIERVPVVNIQHLSVAWKGPEAKPPKSTLVRTAEGRIIVRVNETHVFTEAELSLLVQSGETAEWRLRLPALPADAALEVKISVPDEQRVQSIEQPNEKQDRILTIRLNESSAEPLRVRLHIRQPRLDGPIKIGPFAVLDALTQRGEIEVHAPDELRLRFPQAASEVSQRGVSEDQRGESVRAVFGYWNMPSATKPSQPVPPLLTLQVEALKGAVETQVTQSLHLEKGVEGTLGWQLKTLIKLTPIRTAVDRVEVLLPAGYEYVKPAGVAPAEIVEDVVLEPSKQTAQIKLAHKQTLPFALTLVGSYRIPAGAEEASVELVRPLSWSVERGGAGQRLSAPILDRGCQVKVALPEGVEFVARSMREGTESTAREAFPAIVPFSPKLGTRDYTWQGEGTPARVDLAWRVHRPGLPVDSVADVTLTGRQAQVRQQLRYQFGQVTVNSLLLQVPPEIQQRVRVLEGGTQEDQDLKPSGEWAISIPSTASKEHTLTVEYSFSLPDAPVRTAASGSNESSKSKSPSRRFAVPLIRPLQATRGETKVRVWCDPGEQPNLASKSWIELPTEIVPDQDNLPALVVRAGQETPLVLRLTESAVAPSAAAVVEHILVQAVVREGGMQSYRARFLLSKLSARHLELVLPVLLSGSDLDVRVDGKKVPGDLLNESGKETDIGRVLRLRLEPTLYHKPVLLEVNYQADSGRMDGNSPWQLTLRPPVLREAILLGRARWQVDLPAGWMSVAPRGGSSVEQRWGWWGWLPAPRPALSRSDLEQWIRGTQMPAPGQDSMPSLVCWQSALGPLTLLQVPQRVWLLVCSLTILALGLGLLLAPVSRYLLWSCVVILSATVAAIGVFSPAALPAIGYGCEPGAFVLLLAVAGQWMLHRRYRRQVIFMPGFTRLKTGSSLIRPSTSSRPRDPSTVDEPPKHPSSVVSGAQPGNSEH